MVGRLDGWLVAGGVWLFRFFYRMLHPWRTRMSVLLYLVEKLRELFERGLWAVSSVLVLVDARNC